MKENRPVKEGYVGTAQILYKEVTMFDVPAAKSPRPFTDGNFVKEYSQSTCTEICPECQG